MRVGIIIDDSKVPNWINEVIKEISLVNNIQWTTVIRVTTDLQSDPSSFRFFRKIDDLILPNKPNLIEKVDLKLPSKTHEIKISLVKKGKYCSFTPNDLHSLIDTKPDVILHFGSILLQGEILNLPKFGVWCLCHGMATQSVTSPTGFWEWYYHQPVSQAYIIRVTNSEKGYECLVNATTRTEQLSYGRNLLACLSMGIDLLSSLLAKVANDGILPKLHDSLQKNKEHYESKPRIQDSFFAVAKLVRRLMAKLIKKMMFIEQWVLFYSFKSQDLPHLNFQKFKALIPPKDRIWADPFVVSKNGKHYLFIEELLRKTNKGHISCLVMNEFGAIEDSKLLIDKPYHLSYPFIFQHENTWYMIPESAEGKTVDLFECIDFPFEWKFKRSLLSEVEAFDSTVHSHEGQFWLFCTIKKTVGGSSDDNLYLFHTNDLLKGKWTSHPNNPIVSDPFSARPAGRIFVHDNFIYRPSQICVPRYGYGLALNRITELNESTYKEEIVTKAQPTWRRDLLSVHTFNFEQGFTVIDGQITRLKF